MLLFAVWKTVLIYYVESEDLRSDWIEKNRRLTDNSNDTYDRSSREETRGKRKCKGDEPIVIVGGQA